MALIFRSVKTCALGRYLLDNCCCLVFTLAFMFWTFCLLVSFPTQTLVGVNKSYSNLWLVTSFMLPTCFLHSPPRSPTTTNSNNNNNNNNNEHFYGAWSLAKSRAQCAVQKAAVKCTNTYDRQNKKVSGHTTAKSCRKNWLTAISVNKPKLSVTKHDQTLIWAHTYIIQVDILQTQKRTAGYCTHTRTHARAHARTHAHTHTRARTHERTHARTQGVYPQNLQVVSCPNKPRSFEPFMCLDLVLER